MKKDANYGTKETVSRICVIAAAILLAGTMTACATAGEKETNEASEISAQNRDIGDGTAASVIAEYPTADTDNHTLMQGINSFAYDMSGYLEADGGNYFFSPYSLGIALTILDNAAEGDTKSQIESLFDIADIQDWNMQLSLYMNKEQPEQALITSANSLWIDKQYAFSDRGYESYLPLVEYYYDAQIYNADFLNNPDGTKEMINQWVSENTNGMIKNFKKDVNKDICLSIINAVYFYGEWRWPFKSEATSQEPFYGKNRKTMVDMMSNGEIHLSYYESDGIRGLSMPYGDGSKVMNILLPSEDAGQPVEELFSNLSDDEKNRFLSKLMNSETSYIQKIFLPKFNMDYSVDSLIDILKEMGMVNAFDGSLADFPGIGDEIYVVDASHVAKLEVDELGSRAAAVTEFDTNTAGVHIVEEPIEFKVNQPFIFFIQDKETGVILFMGQVNDFENVQGTWQELAEQGYIDGEALYWENGCLFSVTEKEMEGVYSLNVVKFDAEKWRSGLGAYYFGDCTSVQSALGKWGEYKISWEAIS